jgi:hypothetical protein
MPDVMKALRDEVTSILSEHDGEFTAKALYEMKLMDSFMKESIRMNPISIGTHTLPYPVEKRGTDTYKSTVSAGSWQACHLI